MLPAAPPRALVWVSGLVVAVGIVMAFAGALHTGATRDEAFHVIRLQNFLDHGYYAGDSAVAEGDPTGSAENTAVYGPVATLLLHGLTVVVGAEGWGTVSSSPHATDVRHLGIVLIGLLGTLAAAAIVRILLGSWRWALVSAAVLLALPMWTGLLMFDVKDMPVASGYSVVTLALVTIAGEHGRRWQRIATLFAGVVLMVGTRPAMLSAVLAGVVVLFVGLLVVKREAVRQAFLEVGAAGIGSLGVLLIVYPKVFAHPGTLLQSGEKSASFRGGGTTSIGYVPFYVLTQTPLLLLVFSGLGLLLAARKVLRRERESLPLALVGTQLCALPLVAILSRSDLYNGLRQLLFFAPAWAVIATLGIAVAARRRTVLVVAALALLLPVADQLREFPYQYTYFNAAFDAGVGNHRPYGVQTDYWRASAPELFPDIPTDGQVLCGPTRRNGVALRFVVGPGRSLDCRLDPLGPLSELWKAEDRPFGDTLPHSQFYAVIDNDYPLPTNCKRTAAVTRPRHGRTITMLYLARCDSGPLPALTEHEVRFVPTTGHQATANFWRYLPRGWVKNVTNSGIAAAEQTPVIAFRAPAACAGPTRCTLVIDAEGAGHLTATVDGRDAEVVASPDRLLVQLPVGTRDAWVSFDSALNNLSLRGIHLQQGTPR